MTFEPDYTAERLARIDERLAQTKSAMAQRPPTDRSRAKDLTSQLDEMLKELRGPNDVVARHRA